MWLHCDIYWNHSVVGLRAAIHKVNEKEKTSRWECQVKSSRFSWSKNMGVYVQSTGVVCNPEVCDVGPALDQRRMGPILDNNPVIYPATGTHPLSSWGAKSRHRVSDPA